MNQQVKEIPEESFIALFKGFPKEGLLEDFIHNLQHLT